MIAPREAGSTFPVSRSRPAAAACTVGATATATTGPTTWFRARTSIGDYLFSLWTGGALLGAKPDEAYFARCDATTMTQTDRSLGRLVCIYGAAPFKPAELESFTISIQTTGPGP